MNQGVFAGRFLPSSTTGIRDRFVVGPVSAVVDAELLQPSTRIRQNVNSKTLKNVRCIR
jgi:hypothetical protein